MPKIEGFAYDGQNEAKFSAHGLTSESVDQVLSSPYFVRKNRKRRRGLFLVIGVDYRGRCIAIPIEPTRENLIWRPITAWPCKESEAVYLAKRKGR